MDPTTTESPRLLKGALFRGIGYEPHPGQLLVHRSKAKMRVLACGVRWGKTTVAVGEAAAELLQPRPDSMGWVVAPTYEQADRIFSKTVAALQRHFAHRIVDIDQRGKRIAVTNLGGGGSVLCSKSADRPDSLLGEGLDWLVLDEATRVDRSIWDEHLSQRLIDRGGSSLLLSTPRGCDWFYEKYRRGQKGRDPDCESWRSPSSDNPHLNPAIIEAEKARVPAEVYAQEYGACFLGEEKMPCLTCGYDPTAMERSLGWDFEGEPPYPRCPECGHDVHRDGVTRETGPSSNLWYRPGPPNPSVLPGIAEPSGP